MRPFVSIIIPNYNGSQYLNTCLSSVFKLSYGNFEVILVDDGSTDESLKIIEKFQKRYRNLVLLKNKKNLGAAASRNVASLRARGEIILYLDNDTEVLRGTLANIVKELTSDETIGAAQALILDFENRDKIQMAGGLLIPGLGWLAPFYQNKIYSKVKDKLRGDDIIGISAALAIKKEVLNKVKGFDEKEGVYTEDLDFCWRIWISGYRIVLAPKAIVFHWSKSVANRISMNATYQKIYFNLAKNSFRSIIKNFQLWNVVRFLPISIFVNLGRGFLFIFIRKSFAAFWGTLQAFYWILVNLGDTIRSRREVSLVRKVGDNLMMDKIFTKDSLIKIYKKYYI